MSSETTNFGKHIQDWIKQLYNKCVELVSNHNSSAKAHANGFNHPIIITDTKYDSDDAELEPLLEFRTDHGVDVNTNNQTFGWIRWISDGNYLGYIDMDVNIKETDKISRTHMDFTLYNRFPGTQPNGEKDSGNRDVILLYIDNDYTNNSYEKGVDFCGSTLNRGVVKQTPQGDYDLPNKKYVDTCDKSLSDSLSALDSRLSGSLMVPDYSRSTDITSRTTYTVPSNGYVLIVTKTNTEAYVDVTYAGGGTLRLYSASSGLHIAEHTLIPVAKNDPLTFGGTFDVKRFIYCK